MTPRSVLVLLPLMAAACLSPDRKEQIISVVTGCPCYEELVHFPSPRKPPGPGEPEKNPEFGLPKGAAQEMGEDKYLDKMYEGMKAEFEKSGIKLKPIEDGFHATGMSLQKVKDKKKTRELLVSIDGDISFAHGSSLVTPQAQAIIDKVAKALAAYPDIFIKVGGHTDSTGARSLNIILSRDRAQATADLIIKAGKIDRARVREIRGFADDQRIVITPLAEVRNRRVEIRMAP